MKALTYDGKVVQVEQQEFEVSPTMTWVDCPDDCVPGWIYENGAVHAPIIPPKPIEEVLAEFSAGIQIYLDSVAIGKGYQNALYCLSYLASEISAWKAEAETFLAWRDSVWVYSLAELAKFQSGEREAVSFDDFIQELPVIAWPV